MVYKFCYLCFSKNSEMQIITFTFNPFFENTYILFDETREAVIIDPGCYTTQEKEKLHNFIREKKLIIKEILLTHAHIDHLCGLGETARIYKKTPRIPAGEIEMYQQMEIQSVMFQFPVEALPEPSADLQEGKKISFGNTELEVMECAGHSPGHVVFFHKKQKILIGGDVLFKQSIGRTDLPGGNHELLIRNIKTKIFPLGEEVIVYPGHGPITTIGEEKRYNPFLQ